MADLLQILPDFDVESYSYLLTALDRHQIITSDLLTLEASELAKRAKLPLPQLKNLLDEIIGQLHKSSGLLTVIDVNNAEDHIKGDDEVPNAPDEKELLSAGAQSLNLISTLDEKFDEALAGGFPTGYVSEVTGESGAGKTQLTLNLLLSAQLQSSNGSLSSALYLTTESPLPTSRLTQILATNPKLHSSGSQNPSLSRVLTLYTPDLESQDHILRYQVPVAVKRYNVRLIVIDSIAANYRAELELRRNDKVKTNAATGASGGLHERTSRLIQLGNLLRGIAQKYSVCIVVANQVADRFIVDEAQTQTQVKFSDREDQSFSHTFQPVLSLEHQQRWFTGWGDLRNANRLKTPSLGLVWTNQIACRVALTKEPIYDWESHLRRMADGVERSIDEVHDTHITEWKRYFRVAFSQWAPQERTKGVPYEIAKSGIRSLLSSEA